MMRMDAWWLIWVLVVFVVALLGLLSHAQAQVPTGIRVIFSESVRPATAGLHYVQYRSVLREAKLWLRKETDRVYSATPAASLWDVPWAEFEIPLGNWVDLAANPNERAFRRWENPDLTPPSAVVEVILPVAKVQAKVVAASAPTGVELKGPKTRGSWYE